MQSGISIAIWKYFRIQLSDDPTFFENDCDFVEIPMPYKNVTFKEYSPINFINFRMLHYVRVNYEKSFVNPTHDKGLVKDFGSTLLYSIDRQFVIQPLLEDNINAVIPKLFMFFSHYCIHPDCFLPGISGLYSLEFDSDVYYYMVFTNCLPEYHEGSTSMYFINGVDVNDNINTSNLSERLREKDFEEEFPDGLGLSSNIKNQFINILNEDSLFLTDLGVINYCLVIFTEIFEASATKNFIRPTDRYTHLIKGYAIINRNGDHLYIVVTIGIFDRFDKHTRTSIIDGDVVNEPPINDQKQYINYIKK